MAKRYQNVTQADQPAQQDDVQPLRIFRNKRATFQLIRKLGPGLIAGVADDDPSAIGAYAIVGASLGYATLWTTIVTLPMMIVVQYIAAKIGLVAARGLGSVLRKHYPRAVTYPVVLALFIVNVVTAGVDIGVMAAAINLLVPISPALLIVAVALIIVAIEVFGSYRQISQLFKWLSLALLAYIGAAIFAHPALGDVLRNTFVPSIQLNSQFLTVLVAILGQALTPLHVLLADR